MNPRFLLKWLASGAVGFIAAGAVATVLSPCALITMVGSGFLGAWILYHFSVVPLAIGTSTSQAILLRDYGRFGIPWVVSTTAGWPLAAIVALVLPEATALETFSIPTLISLWLLGGLIAGLLQWLAVSRSPRGLLWIPASTVASLSIPATALILVQLSSLVLRDGSPPATEDSSA
jgi:hypothetical protein